MLVWKSFQRKQNCCWSSIAVSCTESAKFNLFLCKENKNFLSNDPYFSVSQTAAFGLDAQSPRRKTTINNLLN